MSILRPIDQHGAFIPFNSPAPVPASDITASPQVSISFNETWIPAVFSALKALCRPESWEGTLADINRATQDSHNLFATGVGAMQIGTILPTMLATLPSDWLACDGASHLRVDYPELYAIIDAAYIIDADHFMTPDLRGRTPLGAGAGPGLTNRAVNAQGGAETHALSIAELASHDHNLIPEAKTMTMVSTEAGGTVAFPAGTAKIYQRQKTGTNGSGTAHNNMQPFTALTYAVVAR